MAQIVALGEVLIDFAQKKGNADGGGFIFEANPGGAPPNMLAAAQKLGVSTLIMGKVGCDMFGALLTDTFKKLGVDTSNLLVTGEQFTTLAFVKLDESGNRSFSFSRINSADINLSKDELCLEHILKADIFHCGTLSLTASPAKEATLAALEYAKKHKKLISVDPNLREPLWKSAADAKAAMKTALSYADILKISDYELEFLYGKGDVPDLCAKLFAEFTPKILFATCGKDGAYMFYGAGKSVFEPCYQVKTIDTTGAGDAFTGAALAYLVKKGLDPAHLDEAQSRALLRYANAAANLSTTRMGGIPSMPSEEEIIALLASQD